MQCNRPFLNSNKSVFDAIQDGTMFLIQPCKGCEICIPTKELYEDIH